MTSDENDKLRDIATCMIGIDYQVDMTRKVYDDMGITNFQLLFILEEIMYKSTQIKNKLAELYEKTPSYTDSEIGKD